MDSTGRRACRPLCKEDSLATRYPRAILALAAPSFINRGYDIVGDAKLKIVKMNEFPQGSVQRLANFVDVVFYLNEPTPYHLSDLPTFSSIAAIEQN